MPNFISEDQIEQALLQRLQHVCGFDVLDCNTANPADLNDGSGRTDKREVLLPARLKAAALRLNPADSRAGGGRSASPAGGSAPGHEPGGGQPRGGRPAARWHRREF
ncbi:hypothetical protein LP416_09730 [Polaromonas sp. P2-4]|nr:hypothetical protein LP416_09730 [Polaromonas sp. P2-4]